MKLVASLIVGENERERYLVPCVEHLLAFCDEVVLLFDGTGEWAGDLIGAWADDGSRVIGVTRGYGEDAVKFFAHEGRARQRLVDATLARSPSHVLSVDCDEFVSAGQELRARLAADPDVPVWSLQMEEVWNANETLHVREDGGWRSHPVPFLWKAPRAGERWTMRDKKLACGRVPTQVMQQGRAKPTGASILHFGWANPAERAKRIDRYKQHDGGKFHASSHLRSLEWPESRMRLRERPWPAGVVFDSLRERFMVQA